MQIQLKLDPDPTTLLPRDPRTAFRVAMSAVNRTMTTGRTRLGKALRAELALKAAVVRSAIRVTKVNVDAAKTGNVTAKLEISRRKIPLIEFQNPVQTPAGVAVTVSKSKGREVLASTFLARMRSGHVGVFERRRIVDARMVGLPPTVAGARQGLSRGRGGKPREAPTRAPRLPIEERHGKTLVGYLANAPGVLDREVSGLQAVLRKNIISQLSRFAAKRGADKVDAALASVLAAEGGE